MKNNFRRNRRSSCSPNNHCPPTLLQGVPPILWISRPFLRPVLQLLTLQSPRRDPAAGPSGPRGHKGAPLPWHASPRSSCSYTGDPLFRVHVQGARRAPCFPPAAPAGPPARPRGPGWTEVPPGHRTRSLRPPRSPRSRLPYGSASRATSVLPAAPSRPKSKQVSLILMMPELFPPAHLISRNKIS